MKDRLNAGDRTHTFTSAEAVEALDYIVRHKPGIVALELEFSSSSRGAALIERIKADPSKGQYKEAYLVIHGTWADRRAGQSKQSGQWPRHKQSSD